MLRQGFPKSRKPISDLGEAELEHVAGGSRWEAEIQQAALNAVNNVVGREEQQGLSERQQLGWRVWQQQANRAARTRDRAHLAEVANSLRGPPAAMTKLQCNLLVIEP